MSFQGQSLIPITLDSDYNLAGAEVTKIKYKKPSGEVGEWSAIVDGDTLVYNPIEGDIDEAGLWEVQVYVEISGEIGYGDKAYILFKNPIS